MKTTRESAKEDTQKKLVSNLQELLVNHYDANRGFKKAFKEVKDQELKEHCKVQAFLHQRYATELSTFIHNLNHKPVEEGSTAGKFHRIWIDVATAISNNDDKIIWEECRRGQMATIKEYKEKLQNHKFPAEIKNSLKRHLVEMEINRDELKQNKNDIDKG
ncbi:hypothetical protein BH23BAC2_BH23BAC2_07690 [soil metagenome]